MHQLHKYTHSFPPPLSFFFLFIIQRAVKTNEKREASRGRKKKNPISKLIINLTDDS